MLHIDFTPAWGVWPASLATELFSKIDDWDSHWIMLSESRKTIQFEATGRSETVRSLLIVLAIQGKNGDPSIAINTRLELEKPGKNQDQFSKQFSSSDEAWRRVNSFYSSISFFIYLSGLAFWKHGVFYSKLLCSGWRQSWYIRIRVPS